MGGWLSINGEAIYKSNSWTTQNDTANGRVWYTASSDMSAVYAISLEWPEEERLRVAAPKVRVAKLPIIV
jgi:hypothetical protein